jgi:hypothetical protein
MNIAIEIEVNIRIVLQVLASKGILFDCGKNASNDFLEGIDN